MENNDLQKQHLKIAQATHDMMKRMEEKGTHAVDLALEKKRTAENAMAESNSKGSGDMNKARKRAKQTRTSGEKRPKPQKVTTINFFGAYELTCMTKCSLLFGRNQLMGKR